MDLGPTTELGDVDGDGDLDVVAVLSGKLALYKNNGNRSFSGGSTGNASIGAFALGDVDGDGDLDIVNAPNDTSVAVLKNLCAGDTCGCGNGNLDGHEACDDGPDGSATCDPDCTLRSCGDLYVNALAGEECDDGNTVDADECTNGCKDPTCDDGLRNGDESDVDCGRSCGAGCPAHALCVGGDDCESGTCLGGRCTWFADFEDGEMPEALTTSGDADWTVDTSAGSATNLGPIGGQGSLISGALVFGISGTGEGASSLYLNATFGPGVGTINFTTLTNCHDPNGLVFLIDGIEAETITGRRLRLDDAYLISYDVAPGAHTFEWRYEGYTSSSAGLEVAPFNRVWLDDLELVNGAP